MFIVSLLIHGYLTPTIILKSITSIMLRMTIEYAIYNGLHALRTQCLGGTNNKYMKMTYVYHTNKIKRKLLYLHTYVLAGGGTDRKSTRLNSSHLGISYAV